MEEVTAVIQIVADLGALGVMAYINIRLWNRLTEVVNTHTKYIQDENRRLNDEIGRQLATNKLPGEIRFSGASEKVDKPASAAG